MNSDGQLLMGSCKWRYAPDECSAHTIWWWSDEMLLWLSVLKCICAKSYFEMYTEQAKYARLGHFFSNLSQNPLIRVFWTKKLFLLFFLNNNCYSANSVKPKPDSPAQHMFPARPKPSPPPTPCAVSFTDNRGRGRISLTIWFGGIELSSWHILLPYFNHYCMHCVQQIKLLNTHTKKLAKIKNYFKIYQ